jgi:hypothetical protein
MKWTRVSFAMRKFQKCTKSQEKLPNTHKTKRGSSKNPHDLSIDFKQCPHGEWYTCPFHPFTYSLQNTCFCNMNTDWLRLSLAATSSKRHPVITNIRVTRPRLIQRRWIVTFVWRRCPSLGLSQIFFMIWYDFSHIFYFNNFYCKQALVRVNYWW